MKFAVLCVTAIAMTATAAYAFHAAQVPPQKRTKVAQYLAAQEAASFVANSPSKTLFLDVRTPAEAMFVGMPTLADANVPYMYSVVDGFEGDLATQGPKAGQRAVK